MYVCVSVCLSVCLSAWPIHIGSLYMSLLFPSADPPNQPQFEYCISYNDGQPELQVISYVCKYSIMYVISYKIVSSQCNHELCTCT